MTAIFDVQGKGVVVCGDDKGSLWLYNLPGMVKTSPEPIKKCVDPTTRLMWPELQVTSEIRVSEPIAPCK